MLKQCLIIAICAAIFASAFACLSHAGMGDNANADSSKKTYVAGGEGFYPNSWVWTKEQWTGDDQPFVKIRSDIDKAITEKRFDSFLLEAYQQHAQQEPTFAEAQFGWAYAAYKAPYAGLRMGSVLETMQTFNHIAWALERVEKVAFWVSGDLFLSPWKLDFRSKTRFSGRRIPDQHPKFGLSQHTLSESTSSSLV